MLSDKEITAIWDKAMNKAGSIALNKVQTMEMLREVSLASSRSTIQQAVSECSVGGEAMREAAAALVEKGTCKNPRCWCARRIGLADEIRALPLSPSPVKGENVTRQGGDEE